MVIIIEPVYFNVPYMQRLFAKKFGARWSPEKRAWYANNEEVLARMRKHFEVIVY